MQPGAAILIHVSEVYFEGLRSILEGTSLAVLWAPVDADRTARALISEGRAPHFVLGIGSPEQALGQIHRLRRAFPEAPISTIGVVDNTWIAEAVAAGATGHIDEALSGELVAKSLELMHYGAVILPPGAIQHFGDLATDSAAAAKPTRDGDPPPAAPLRNDAAPDAPKDRVEAPEDAEPTLAPRCAETHVESAAPSPRLLTFGVTGSPPRPMERDSHPLGKQGHDGAGVRQDEISRSVGAQHRSLAPPKPTAGNGEGLSERETDILRCLLKGEANKEIARSLDMAETTVKAHLKAITRKLRVRNRTQAAIWAFQHLDGEDGVFDAPGA